MKGDDQRAELLAKVLDGGPVADEVEPLLPALTRIRDLLDRLDPGPERVTALLPRLYRQYLGDPQRVVVELAHPTLYVRDMEAALRFYRDVLGLRPRSESEWFSELEAGAGAIALHWTGSPTRLAQVGDVRLEFRTRDLDRTVEQLRELGIQVALGRGHRGRFAELRDPDGYTIRLIGAVAARLRPYELRRSEARREGGQAGE
jgi:catechol 2,3-dioxygenase-like lactoylglutathione lyase family enzyme